MEALIIGEKEKIDLKSLAKYANDNPLSTDNLLDIMNNPVDSPGVNPEYQRKLPVDFKVVFTIDEYPEYKVRHVSISRDKKNILPSISAASMIISELGFVNNIKNCKVFIENLELGYKAINIGELI